MEICEVMTSSTHSFAYSYRLVKKCFVKISETSKCHNFLIFQPIFIRFSLLCLKIFTLSSEIKLNLLWSSSLMVQAHDFMHTWCVTSRAVTRSVWRPWISRSVCAINDKTSVVCLPTWLLVGPSILWMMSIANSVEPRYNEVHGTMKITLLYQVSHYIRVKNIYKEMGPAKLPCYKRVLLYLTSL